MSDKLQLFENFIQEFIEINESRPDLLIKEFKTWYNENIGSTVDNEYYEDKKLMLKLFRTNIK
jgi:hypothetical protein